MDFLNARCPEARNQASDAAVASAPPQTNGRFYGIEFWPWRRAIRPPRSLSSCRSWLATKHCQDDIRIAIARKVPAEKPSKTANARARKTKVAKAQVAGNKTYPKSHKGTATTFARLDLLLSIVRSEAVTEAGRRKAASELAEFFLPKSLGRKRIKFPADEFGFSVDPQLAKEFRDIRWEIACLAYKRNKLPPDAFAKKVSKLHARLNAIRQVLQPPDYSKYNKKSN